MAPSSTNGSKGGDGGTRGEGGVAGDSGGVDGGGLFSSSNSSMRSPSPSAAYVTTFSLVYFLSTKSCLYFPVVRYLHAAICSTVPRHRYAGGQGGGGWCPRSLCHSKSSSRRLRCTCKGGCGGHHFGGGGGVGGRGKGGGLGGGGNGGMPVTRTATAADARSKLVWFRCAAIVSDVSP